MKGLIGTTAILLIAGGISIAAAQDPKGPGPASPEGPASAEPKSPPKDAIPEKAPPDVKKSRPDSAGPGKSSEAPGKEPSKSTEAPSKGKKGDRAASDKDESGAKSSSPKSASPAEDDKKTRSGERDRKDRPSTATSPSDKKSGSKTGERTGKEETPKAAAPDDSKRKTATPGKDEKSDTAKKSVQLSDQQRTTVRQKLERERSSHTTNVQFNISIGTHVPRDVRLYAIPADIVEIVPAYRSYRYVWVADEIVIIDPGTYAIVAVIDRGGGSHASGPGHSTRLSLSDAERRIVVREVSSRREGPPIKGFAVEIGRQLPDSIRVSAFPEPVIAEVPKLRDYRYVVAGEEIVIVDARDAIVALTIEQ
jgi:hypothetical protein